MTRYPSLPMFTKKDIIHASEYGFSIYKNVIIQWDEDYDERIMIFLNKQSDYILSRLVMVHEHEAGLSLLWRSGGCSLSEGLEVGVDGDIWQIVSSREVEAPQ